MSVFSCMFCALNQGRMEGCVLHSICNICVVVVHRSSDHTQQWHAAKHRRRPEVFHMHILGFFHIVNP